MPMLSWYFNRLRQMSPAEIVSRIGREVKVRTEQFGVLPAREAPPPLSIDSGSPFVSVPFIANPSGYIAAADSLLAGKIDLFALHGIRCGFPPDWNRDLRTGTQAPRTFGKTLNYRDPRLVGDIKYLWELNRHLHLVPLAQAFRLSGDSRYRDGIGRLLRSWFDQCPPLRGPNWTSALESGIRLINWSIVWQLIGGHRSPLFSGERGESLLADWLDSIFRHATFIRDNFSRHSSANNHLIGEAAGLFIATCSWPFWRRFQDLQITAFDLLVREATAQNHPDGVNKEQAISYQQFVLDFLLLSGLAGKANGVEFPSDYWKTQEDMLEFIASIMDVAGHVPMIGDADDGYVVGLSPEKDFCPYRSLLATGAVLFKRGDFKAKAGRLDEKTRWLLGDVARQTFDSLAVSPKPFKRTFPQGGYYILGCDIDTPQEIRLIADAGPLGYLSLAAHGHADALSFVLSAGGREILIDPGTYAYHTQQRWRNYFRGSAAHNTLRVDGQDQSLPGGNFMWLEKAQAKCQKWTSDSNQDRFIGVHDGYQRLADPVTHTREICLDKKKRRVEVTDALECRKEHWVERFLHFSESCRVIQDDGELRVECHGGEATIRSRTPGSESTLHRGSSSPPCGWVSRRYDCKQPIITAVFRDLVQGSSCLSLEIDLSRFTFSQPEKNQPGR